MRIEAKEAPVPSMELAEEPGTALALIDDSPAALVYAPGALTALVDRLKAEVRGQLATLDVSMPKDRQRMISLSARVATAKVKLDKMGDSLIEEHRAVVTAVNADRKVMRDDLDAFKIEVRKPVTDLENAEKDRVAGHERALNIFNELVALPMGQTTPELVEERIKQVSDAFERDWQEFSARAKTSRDAALYSLNGMLAAVKQAEADRVEAERLRAEAVERAIKAREEEAARAATEAAQRRAEEQARIAREAAEMERLRVENERVQAEARAKQAEAERIASEQRAVEERERLEREATAERERAAQALRESEAKRVLDAEEAARQRVRDAAQAERDRQAAVVAERQRLEAQQTEERRQAEEQAEHARQEQAKRERNKKHRAEIESAAVSAFDRLHIPEDDNIGIYVVQAIRDGKIPNVTITY